MEEFSKALDKMAIPDRLATAIANGLNETHKRVGEARKRDVEGYKAALKGLETAEDRIYDDHRIGLLDEQGYKRQIERTRQERARLTDLMASSQREMDGAYLITANKILELAKSAKNLWLSRSREEKRDFLEMVLSNRAFDAPTVRYELKKPFRILSEMASFVEWRPQGDSNPCCRRERAVS